MIEDVIIRKMNQNDIMQVVIIEKQSFTMAWSQKSFEEDIKNPHAAYIVAVINNAVVAYGSYWKVIDQADIINIAVLPEYRQKGIAKKLLQTIITQSKEQKLKQLTLEARISNFAAINLYKSQGFQEVGARKNFYERPKEDAIIMQKQLKQDLIKGIPNKN